MDAETVILLKTNLLLKGTLDSFLFYVNLSPPLFIAFVEAYQFERWRNREREISLFDLFKQCFFFQIFN